MLQFHPYSILTGDTRVEFVIYSVLKISNELQVERYISVGFPFFRQRHNLKAWVFIVPVAIFIVGYK